MVYTESGQGAPLVLVHGSLCDYRVWAFQIATFSAGFRTIAVSLRHFYPERWNGEGNDFSVRQHADDLAVFVKELHAGAVHMVAHSRGGGVALLMAAKHPRLVRSLVLADPAPFEAILPKGADVKMAAEKRKAVVAAAMERLRRGDVDGGLELFVDAVTLPGNWNTFPEAVKQMRRDNAWSLKSLAADAQAPFGCADAKKIEAPVLLVTGDKSPSLYGMMIAALQPCLRQAQRVTIPHASHTMFRDNPEAFNAAVLDFLVILKGR